MENERDSKSSPAYPRNRARGSPQTVPELRLRPTPVGDGTGVPADLIVIAHPSEHLLGTRYRLAPGASLVIGRDESADVSLTDVSSVSRQHARVQHLIEHVVLEDLGSTNGTWVQDVPVEGPLSLKSGDRFRVGSVHFKLLHELDVEAAYHKAVYELMTRDPLTGAWNRRSLESELAREWPRSRRYERPLSLILFDLDRFKEVNDSHGHPCGDAVLRRTADLVHSLLRVEQIFARVGGDEFAIVCPETSLPKAAALAERLRNAIDTLDHPLGAKTFRMTCSFGVAEISGEDWSALYAAADEALYGAKRTGGNRVSSVPAPSND